ncbi:hypothetical protein QT979_01060 [Microcoleus sp. w2-18bC1]|uniref:hypothetical protein n=1 Tax=unclassified Microcoleus TaxID=2642155 RepID=UPI002FD1C7B7
MSLQLRLFGGGQADATKEGGKLAVNDGSHSIDKSKVLASTDAYALSPMNPGNFASIRSVPVIESPRYADKEEAKAMEKMATQCESGAKYAKRLYTALGRIDTADTKVHKEHAKYKGGIARNELRKIKANTTYAKGLHGLREGYAKQGLRLDNADSKARADIDAIKAKLTGGAN